MWRECKITLLRKVKSRWKCCEGFVFGMTLFMFFIWKVFWGFTVSIFYFEMMFHSSFFELSFHFFIWIVFSGFVRPPPTRTSQVCDRRRPVAQDRRTSDLGQEQSDVRQLQVKDRYADGFYNLKMSRYFVLK